MPVMRDQQGANLQTPGVAPVQQSRSPMDYARRDTTVNTQGLQALMNTSRQIAGVVDNIADKTQQQQYVEGQIDAVTGRQTDALNDAWYKADPRSAGFADATGKMAVSSAVANIQANMKQYAQQTPEQFGEVLKGAFGNAISSQQGMSRDGVGASGIYAAQQVQSLSAQHLAAHQKWSIDQYSQAINATGNTIATGLSAAKASGDANAYSAADQAYQVWNAQTLQDEHLPLEVRQAQVVSNAKQILAQGQSLPVENMLNGPIGLNLPADKRAELFTALKQAKNATAFDDNSDLVSTYAQLKAQRESGVPVDPTAWSNVVRNMHERNLLSDGSATEALTAGWKDQYKQAKMNTAIAAIGTGNRSALVQSGISESDALDQFEKQGYQRGLNSVDMFSQMLNFGLQGSTAALKKAGAQAEASLSVFGSGQELNPEAQQTLQGIVGGLDNVSRTNPALYSTVISGLSAENQDKLTFMRDQVRNGMSLDQAGANYATYKQKNDAATAEQRSAIMTQRKADVDAAVKGVTDPGFINQMMGVFGGGLNNSTRAAANNITGDATAAAQQEAAQILHQSPYISASALKDRVAAAVQGRMFTVDASKGQAIVAPQGMTVRGVLGVQNSVSDDDLQTALTSVAKTHAPGDVANLQPQYSITPTGKISIQYLDKDGATAAPPVLIAPQEVQSQTESIYQKRQDAATYAYGTGQPMTVKDQATGKMVNFKVNGANSAGVDETMMLNARKDLIGHEGYSSQVWNNKGTWIDGFSVRTDNPSHSGRVHGGAENGIERNLQDFNRETDRLAIAATRQRTALGWASNGWEDQNQAQFNFLMDMSYHAGPGWMSSNQGLASAIRQGDLGQATKELANTAAYQGASDERRKYMIRNLVGGMTNG